MSTTQRRGGESREALIDALSDFEHAMLITTGPDGLPHARPMAILEREPDGSLWFVSRAHAPKIEEIAHDHRVGVTLQSATEFISLGGWARVVRDSPRVRERWSPYLTPWFPQGPDDPDLRVIHFAPHAGELWKIGSREVVSFLVGAAKAVAKGEPVEPMDEGHDQVVL